MKASFALIKETFGCKKSRLRIHNFQWNMGGISWWMYCTKCGKPVWHESE